MPKVRKKFDWPQWRLERLTVAASINLRVKSCEKLTRECMQCTQCIFAARIDDNMSRSVAVKVDAFFSVLQIRRAENLALFLAF
jgi:hypothetical protein